MYEEVLLYRPITADGEVASARSSEK